LRRSLPVTRLRNAGFLKTAALRSSQAPKRNYCWYRAKEFPWVGEDRHFVVQRRSTYYRRSLCPSWKTSLQRATPGQRNTGRRRRSSRSECLAARRRFFSWQSMLRGSTAARAHQRNFWTVNLLHRAELGLRDGHPLGDQACNGSFLKVR